MKGRHSRESGKSFGALPKEGFTPSNPTILVLKWVQRPGGKPGPTDKLTILDLF